MTLDYLEQEATSTNGAATHDSPMDASDIKEEEIEYDDEEELMIEEDFDEELEEEDISDRSMVSSGSPHSSSSSSGSHASIHSPSLLLLQVESPSHGSSGSSGGSSPSRNGGGGGGGGGGAPEKRHVCPVCGKGFSYFSILESHKRSHTGEKPYNCHFCDKKFAQKATLQVHERTHTGERPYKCRYCVKTFAQYGTKTVHEKSAHLGIRNYKCPKCDKSLSSPSALYTHKKTHGDKTFRCDFCPKTFALKNYLKLHVKQVHEQNERKHVCMHCHKGFAYAGSLQVHVRTHTGERPYVCKHCPKAFASQGNLQSHERTHTGERPYVCRFCPRSFIQKSQQTAHESTHLTHKHPTNPDSTTADIRPTGESPEQSGSCENDGYKHRFNGGAHFPHKCEGCGQSCVQRIALQIHIDQCDAYKNVQRIKRIQNLQNQNSDSESDTEIKICPLPNPPLTLPSTLHQIPPPVNIYAQQPPPTALGSILGNASLTSQSLNFGLTPLTSVSSSVFTTLNAHAPFTPVEMKSVADFGPLTASKPPAGLQPDDAISAFRKVPESPTASLLSSTSLNPLSSSILSTQLLLQQLHTTDLNYLLNQNLLSSLAAGLHLPASGSHHGSGLAPPAQFMMPTSGIVQPLV